MNCPYCGHDDHKVLDSRPAREASAIRRRRECSGCGRRFTTFEEFERRPVFVIKRNGSREEFSYAKCLKSIQIACRKLDIPVSEIEATALRVDSIIWESGVDEIASNQIGEIVLQELLKVNQVAYVRFASVYQEFQTVSDFEQIIRGLVRLSPSL